MSELRYDPYDPATIDDPYPVYRRLRDEAPLYRIERLGIFVLSRHADVRAALLDPATFSSAHGLFLDQDPGAFLKDVQQSDPPRHDRLRKLVLEAFTTRRVAALEPRLRAIVRRLLDPLVAQGGGDFTAELAWPFPATVICELLGVPHGDRERFRRWSYDLATGSRRRDGSNLTAVGAIYAYFGELLAERRRRPANDLVSALLAARLDGEALGEKDLRAFCFLLVVAGHETTTNLLGNAFVQLALRPELRRRLAGDFSRIPDAIEEFLRFDGPVQGLTRTVVRDAELHGVTLHPGEKVHLLFAAANRDERAFERPDELDVERSPNPHLSFGQGIHFCLGAKLARLEMQVALEEVLGRVPEFSLACDRVERLPSPLLRGVERLPLAFGRPAAARAAGGAAGRA
jgi:cytochrome P450